MLRRQGIGAGSHVGFVLADRIAQIVAMLGILRAGAAYVPFDLGNPRPTLSGMAADSEIAAMLVDADGGVGSDRFWEAATITLPPGGNPSATGVGPFLVEPVLVDPATVGPDSPAYVMFTSGSTGRPKPVVVPHRGVVRLVVGADYASFGPDEVFLQLAPLAFDASTFEIWGALLNGGRLVLPTMAQPSLDDIAGLIQGAGVTTLWLTAGLFHLMIDTRLEALRPLRQLLAGGDVLSPAHVGRAMRALPGCRLINGYGPTENTTFTCCHTIRPGDEAGPIPIGTPIAGTEIRLLDPELMAVPPGTVGELYAGGQGVALGYLGLPELTATRFVADPMNPGARLYRTGDMVRQRPDGVLEFHGRQDGQVKLDGKRVELSAIEAALREVAAARDVVVTVAGEPAGRRIVAHLLQPEESTEASGRERDDALRSALRGLLPAYMVPSAFLSHASFPLTVNGKIDRVALNAAFASRNGQGTAGPAPATTTGSLETVVAEVWGRALGISDPPRDRNFFDLGGTSLQLMAIHAELRTRLRSDLDMTDLFARPTIAALAAHLSKKAGSSQDQSAPVEVLAARDRGARQRDAFARLRRTRA